MILDFQNALLIVAGVMNIFLGGLIFAKHRDRFENQIYTVNIIFIIWWVIAMMIYRSIQGPDDLLFLAINLYIAPTFIASTFLYFCLFFPGHAVSNLLYKSILIFVPNAFIAGLVLIPGMVIKEVRPEILGEHTIIFGPLYLIYASYISLYFSMGLAILTLKLFRTDDPVIRRQIAYLLSGYLIASTLAMGTNLVLPWFGDFRLNWLGQALTVFMVVPVTYAIFKHRLFESKVIAAEIFVLVLNIFLLIRALIPQTPEERIINIALFGSALAFGLLLIHSVNKEVQARAQIEKLADDLQRANKRLKELDKMKSEFVSIASHQLRSPLTVIRGYASLLLEGSYGKIPRKAREAIEHISNSSGFMARSVEDYLNVSRIQSGSMKYEHTEFNIKDIAKGIVDDMRPEGMKRGLLITFKSEVKSDCTVNADIGKTRQIIQNLVDNAVKYTKKGSIVIRVCDKKRPKKIFVSVTDTGIGMNPETLESIFGKFERARNANDVNVTGTGLGLFIARRMAEDMGGTVTAHSEGEGKGSTFTLELPLIG